MPIADGANGETGRPLYFFNTVIADPRAGRQIFNFAHDSFPSEGGRKGKCAGTRLPRFGGGPQTIKPDADAHHVEMGVGKKQGAAGRGGVIEGMVALFSKQVS